MEIRGERECKDCGTRWSYYETGSVSCPNCESVRSVGVDEERKRHTAGQAALDLTEVRNMIDAAPESDVADAAIENCREFVRRTGFIDAGELQPLDDVYLAARELRQVADIVGRSYDPTEDEELYYLSLLRGADRGERPAPDEVPAGLREARG
ncbi:TFIIB-type zinc ribbon-containing protein, partial [Natronoarchaeum mannanilyticum]